MTSEEIWGTDSLKTQDEALSSVKRRWFHISLLLPRRARTPCSSPCSTPQFAGAPLLPERAPLSCGIASFTLSQHEALLFHLSLPCRPLAFPLGVSPTGLTYILTWPTSSLSQDVQEELEETEDTGTSPALPSIRCASWLLSFIICIMTKSSNR